MLRMLLKLQQYKLNVHYKRWKDLYIADTLSRAYLPLRDDDSLEEGTMHSLNPNN
jgi:hypothetical protein